MKKESWNYSVWGAFSERLYSKSLNPEHLTDNGGESFIDTVFKIDEVSRDIEEVLVKPAKFRDCVFAQKGEKRYIIPTTYVREMPFNPVSIYECQIKKSDKRKWLFVTEINSLNINGDQTMEFKLFIDEWNPIGHTNPVHFKLSKMIAIATKHKRTNLCLCSEPEFGKNCHYTIMNYIIPDVCRVAKPTLAKFETALYFNSVFIPDELTSLKNADVCELEPTILSVTDVSPEYNKHSMAQKKEMNKTNLLEKSLVFTYNRPQDLADPKTGDMKGTFFDDLWNNPAAIKSRLPQLLLTGTVIEKVKSLNPQQSEKMMKEEFESLRVVAKAYAYYCENLSKHLHNYRYPESVNRLSNRHATNIQGVIDVMDAYSDTQEEFDGWVEVLMNSIKAYKNMVGANQYKSGTLG